MIFAALADDLQFTSKLSYVSKRAWKAEEHQHNDLVIIDRVGWKSNYALRLFFCVHYERSEFVPAPDCVPVPVFSHHFLFNSYRKKRARARNRARARKSAQNSYRKSSSNTKNFVKLSKFLFGPYC